MSSSVIGKLKRLLAEQVIISIRYISINIRYISEAPARSTQVIIVLISIRYNSIRHIYCVLEFGIGISVSDTYIVYWN